MSVGKPLPHDTAALHVTGAARYVDDIPTPAGTLHLAFGLSPVARGALTAMDLSAVRAAPGVVTVLTADDLPFANDVSPSVHDEPLLATDRVHYVGQPLFLVVATSHLAARTAARLGTPEIAEETPILTVDEALAADSRFEDGPVIWTKGQAEVAITTAPRVVQGQIEVGGQEHFYLEGQAALALPQDGGEMVVHSSTQHPTEIQHKVAEALGLPMRDVRVETRRMGGGFGGKESQGNALAVACAVAARATGRPCKMRYDRDDDMVITGKRHDLRIEYRAGFDETGRLLGVEFRHLIRCGWAQDLSLPVADRAMLHADNAYLLDHVRIESHRLKTNTCSATAFRGFGGPQGMVGIERVMDHIAHDLGLDPLTVRRVNYYADAPAAGAEGGPSAPPQHSQGNVAPPEDISKTKESGDLASRGALDVPEPHVVGEAEGQTTPYGMAVTDFILNRMTDDLAARCEYDARRARVAEWNAGNPLLKRGIALTPVKFGISFTLTHLNQAGALVHVYQDGSVQVNHGGTEMGQGLYQKMAQVAGESFGLGLEAIKVTATDTGKVPNTSATAASSGSDLNGMAVKRACDAIRERMADCLAGLYQVPVEDVVFAENRVRIGAEEISFPRAAQLAYENRVSLSATGFYKTPDLAWDRKAGTGRPFFYFAHGAACTEVVIDTLTGEYRILRTDILHDVGRSLNPALDIGQIEGGYVQGAGWLTTEELVWDDKGRLRTHAPSTYKIPACGDRPEVFNVALWDGENAAETIYRSKAVGEPPFMLGISALMALSDAVGACGAAYPALDAPATPEQVLAAVRRVRHG
ncbi:xanthine dehydrogenase, molybdenum binding subunit apoprotein [Pseudooceanicola nitratireducens]|jgi:xanthine dehydrogenase large subunit|uniref:Xanthine dehydrogenase, molybdenum binding subunit apoprotein n=1 Tax=Pseudooceanicola nitratireducens TaxID=517719 RepID=A0A1I1IT14_9RHOB|nr:xanthine dehydrogenase molybdopterin binding subunit [Pseudooceanicola nitratireducens]SEJ25896.1 xanthine dehydrogenase, molybdenum binding subunit apoprotein [Pseudooceanicola nitratireducens]SFC38872.1 xanthine dehydrogenase, molybdenum binding subunit apoprotein [Pseudooceanicola nitratireducens]